MKDRIPFDQLENIKPNFKKGKIPQLTALWHTEQMNIDFEKQGGLAGKNHFSEGYKIIEVNIHDLINSFLPHEIPVYMRKELFKKEQCEHQTSGVIYKWLQGIPLIPPTILDIHNNGCLYPIDGKHRLNVAYFFGAETIPIIVANTQLEKVKQILNLS